MRLISTSSTRAAAVLTVGGAALLFSPWAATAGEQSMEMRDFAFSAPALQVAVGDTVTWTNQDKALHDATTTNAPVKFESPLLKQGESWSYTFTAPGVYSYICSLHEKMVASITATGPAATAPDTAHTGHEKAAAEAKKTAKADTTKVAAAKSGKTFDATPTPSPTPSPTPKVKPAKAPKIVAAAPVAPVAPAAAPAAQPVAAPVSNSDELDLMPAVQAGGVAVALAVLGLLIYGFRTGRRAE